MNRHEAALPFLLCDRRELDFRRVLACEPLWVRSRHEPSLSYTAEGDRHMSMSMHVVGFRLPDERWHKMKTVYDACEAAGIEVPSEVEDFFGGKAPDPKGIEVELEPEEYEGSFAEGLEIALANVPENVTHIRFFCAW